MKIEPGKYYRDRWGDLHGPMDERSPGCFLDQHGAVYQPDGRQWNHLSESMSTIIREADECPNCHNANKHGDYEGPTCDVCRGEGFVPAQTMQWQPRETAPKTGKPFLAFFPDGDFTPETGIDVIWWEPSEERFLIGGSPIIWKFTHWTPLPTAPAIPSTLLGAEPSAPASESSHG